MVTLRMVVPLGLLLVVFGGCGGNGNEEGSTCELLGGGLVTDLSTIGEITYRVVGGFSGAGDGTSLQIEPDGTLVRTTRQSGTEQGQLDRATLDDLVGKVKAAQFPTLCSHYACAHCADEYTYQVSVHIDGNDYTVQASSLASSLPDGLDALIKTLQAIVARPLS